MGNSISTNPDPNTKSGKSQINSKVSSSFGNADPWAIFRNNFRDWADEEKIPGLRAVHTYQLYTWKQGNSDYGHYSVVIGCNSRSNVGYVTMELYVNVNTQKIVPVTNFITQDRGLQHITHKKWTPCTYQNIFAKVRSKLLGKEISVEWNGEVQTTMKNLMKLTEDLIRNHGKYSTISNSCQDFVINFVRKCAQKENHGGTSISHGGEKAAMLGGMGLGSLGGASVGAMVAGPPGAVLGAMTGFEGGMIGGMASFGISKSLHNNQAHEVELKNDNQGK
eukprot:419171_1